MSKTAALVIIGNEILSGRTVDSNLNFIAKRLVDLGIKFMETRIVTDTSDDIIEAVNSLRVKYDYVFTTGGIGPTHDDITTFSVSKAFNVDLRKNEEAFCRIESYNKKRGTPMNKGQEKMSYVPEGAELIGNPVSGAPGFHIENVFVLAGIPFIMQAMFDNLEKHLKKSSPILSSTVTINISEGIIADELKELQEKFPKIEIGSYPFQKNGTHAVDVVIRGTDENILKKLAKNIEALAKSYM